MSKGKYSPTVCRIDQNGAKYNKNCYGQVPEVWDFCIYNVKTMLDGYDDEGFDIYGYSAFSKEGEYIGAGRGVDRHGYTERDYQCMSDEEYNSCF